MKKIQKALLSAFLFSYSMLMSQDMTAQEKTEKHEVELKTAGKGKSQDERTERMRLKIGAGPVVEEEYILQYLAFDKLLTIVKQAQQVINAKDEAARESAKKELTELMTKEKLDPLMEKVIASDIEIIKHSTDKAAVNKAYEHLCDIVLAIDAQKEFVKKEGVTMFALYHDENRVISEPLGAGEKEKSGVHYVGFAPKKGEVAKKLQEAQKSQAFDLSTIVQQAERVLKAENDEARINERLKLNALVYDKRLHPAVQGAISEEIAIILGSGDKNTRSKAYDRLRDLIELINSLKFVALNIEPKFTERLEAKIRAITPQPIQDIAGKVPGWLNKLETPYRKSEDLIKKIVPQSVQNILDKPVDYIFGGDAHKKGEFYRGLWLGTTLIAAGSGIRAMFNKYKIFSNMPEWTKKIDEIVTLKDAATKRAVEISRKGGDFRKDDVFSELDNKINTKVKEANVLGKLLWKAGVPGDVLKKIAAKTYEFLLPAERIQPQVEQK